MKKALTFFSFVSLISLGLASVGLNAKTVSNEAMSACILHLPQVVLISQDMRDLNFSKSQYVDAFWDYESGKTGQGFAYQYQNSFCHAKVQLYRDNQSRLNNIKVQRMLKDKTTFPVQKQKNLKIGNTKFYGAYGQDEDVSNTLIYGDYKENFLKIRMTCMVLPRYSVEKYQQTIDEMTTVFTEGIVDSLDACIK